VYKWRRLAELGVIGMTGVSELPAFVAVNIAQEAASLPVLRAKDKPPAEVEPQRRSRRWTAGLIEIDLEGGRRVRVDRDVDVAALKRVLDALERR
jgi:transposase